MIPCMHFPAPRALHAPQRPPSSETLRHFYCPPGVRVHTIHFGISFVRIDTFVDTSVFLSREMTDRLDLCRKCYSATQCTCAIGRGKRRAQSNPSSARADALRRRVAEDF